MTNYIPVTNTDELTVALQRCREAQAIFATYSQEQVDRIFLAAATAANKARIPLAKAAVAAGIAVLLKEAEIKAEDLDALYLAGGFGTYMDIRSAAVIGMFPACLTERAVRQSIYLSAGPGRICLCIYSVHYVFGRS